MSQHPLDAMSISDMWLPAGLDHSLDAPDDPWPKRCTATTSVGGAPFKQIKVRGQAGFIV